MNPTTLPVWQSLAQHADAITQHPLRELASDAGRQEALTLSWGSLLLDSTRQHATSAVWHDLLRLAEDCGVPQRIAAMAAGEHINTTEDRAVLHLALRADASDAYADNGQAVGADVAAVRAQIAAFADRVRAGEHRGVTGETLTNVVAIGIGGSYLGPEFVAEALAHEPAAESAADGRTLRFIANVDPVDRHQVLRDLDPARTLVVVISKTFTTVETMLNAKAARRWLVAALGDDAPAAHMVAVSTNAEAVTEFGIDPANMFGFWSWVGGRYSVTSAVGLLPLTLHFGSEVVEQFMTGARAMDQHFLTAPLAENMPVRMALFGIWNRNFLGYSSRALLAYSQALHKFAAHIQQVDMESNGKRVDRTGEEISYPTGEVDFGEPGTNSQHSFMQLVHQGQVVPVDFIGFCRSQADARIDDHPISHHDELMCNLFAQADALAYGKTAAEVRAEGVPEEHVSAKVFPGNRPNHVLLADQLDAWTCGALLALYEHRTAVQGFVWNINSFDQMGVELGKKLATDLRSRLGTAVAGGELPVAGLPASTAALLQRYQAQRSTATR